MHIHWFGYKNTLELLATIVQKRLMDDHRNSKIATIWDTILKKPQESLSGLRGNRGECTALYQRLFKMKGVYVIRSSNGIIVYIGIAGGGDKEGGLAIACGHISHLVQHCVQDCEVMELMWIIAQWQSMRKMIQQYVEGPRCMALQ